MNIENIQKNLLSAAKELLKKEPESISAIEKSEKGWKAQIEVLERKAVPDKFDMLKVFEFALDADGKVLGFKLIKRMLRGDTE